MTDRESLREYFEKYGEEIFFRTIQHSVPYKLGEKSDSECTGALREEHPEVSHGDATTALVLLSTLLDDLVPPHNE